MNLDSNTLLAEIDGYRTQAREARAAMDAARAQRDDLADALYVHLHHFALDRTPTVRAVFAALARVRPEQAARLAQSEAARRAEAVADATGPDYSRGLLETAQAVVMDARGSYDMPAADLAAAVAFLRERVAAWAPSAPARREFWQYDADVRSVCESALAVHDACEGRR